MTRADSLRGSKSGTARGADDRRPLSDRRRWPAALEPRAVTLALRRGGPDDYDVIYDGETVGRIYCMKADRELWRRTIRLVGTSARPQRRVICHPRRGDGGVPREVGNGTLRARATARTGSGTAGFAVLFCLDSVPWATGGADEHLPSTARFHRCARRPGGLAARGARSGRQSR
jgi:hypothetical protein